jgi:hypothetical protein
VLSQNWGDTDNMTYPARNYMSFQSVLHNIDHVTPQLAEEDLLLSHYFIRHAFSGSMGKLLGISF